MNTINWAILRNYVTGSYNITNKKRHSFSGCRFFFFDRKVSEIQYYLNSFVFIYKGFS